MVSGTIMPSARDVMCTLGKAEIESSKSPSTFEISSGDKAGIYYRWRDADCCMVNPRCHDISSI